MSETAENRISGFVGVLFGMFLAGVAWMVSPLPPTMPILTLVIAVVLISVGSYMAISGKNPV